MSKESGPKKENDMPLGFDPSPVPVVKINFMIIYPKLLVG